MRSAAFAVLALLASPAFALTPPGEVALEPGTMSAEGYRLPPYRAATPERHPEAWTVSVEEARALLERREVIALDVMATVARPPSGELKAAFIPSQSRRHLPGSVWLPNVGFDRLAPEIEAYFRTELERLAEGRKDRGLLFYCIADCWASWNAARRAVRLGYTRVYWYPGGTEGWSAAGLPLVEAVPVPLEGAGGR